MSDQTEKGAWPSDDIPSAWEWVKFSEFFQDYTDSRRKLQKKSYQSDGRYPVIDQGEDHIGGFSDNSDLVSTTRLPCIVWGDHTKCIKFVEEKFIQGADGVKILAPRSEIDPLFAYYALRAVVLPDKGYSRHFKFLSSTKFPVAPHAEQRRIVVKLDSLFARAKSARDELARIPHLIEHYKQAILDKAFSGELTADWRQDEGKTNDGPWPIPSSWRWGTFGDLGEVASNLVSPADVLDLPHIAPNHIESGIPKLLPYQTVREDNLKSAKHRFFPGQILYSKIRPYLRKAVSVDFEGVCSADMYPLNPLEDRNYLLYWLLSPGFNDMALEHQGRVVLPKINQEALNRIPTPLPPLDEQKEISERIVKAMDWLSIVAAEHGQAADLIVRLDQSLLAKAFRGELVPQDPTDEPADKLLERIRAVYSGQLKARRGRSSRFREAAGA